MRRTGPARRIAALFLMLTAAFAAGPLAAQERLALVIGNGRFDNLLTLPGAARDAEVLASHLTDAGFDVQLLTDAPLEAVTRATEAFGARLAAAGNGATGLFYYAGYGVQAEGANHLLATDIDLRDMAALDALSLPVEAVFEAMAPAATRIVILDASRTHPFGYLPGASEDGLAAMAPAPGLFVASAAQPGRLAFRGGAGDSLFSASLNDSFAAPPAPIAQAFDSIAQQVRARSDGTQDPWVADGLPGDVLFPVPATAAQEPTDTQIWAEIQKTRDLQQIVTFIREHPGSVHIPAAGALLSEVLGQAAPPDTPPAPDPAIPPADALSAAGNQSQGVSAEEHADPVFFGMSIDELLLQSPIVAPIEGLPLELWQNEHCSTCHNWTPADLCAQGMRYRSVQIGKGAIHPLGGAFRSALKDWASSGCK